MYALISYQLKQKRLCNRHVLRIFLISGAFNPRLGLRLQLQVFCCHLLEKSQGDKGY